MSLNLSRPLNLLDAETTGIRHYEDRIVQLGIIRLYPDGRITEWHSLINPGIKIPPEATAVHKITDEMVADKPTFKQLAPALITRFENADFGGYNLKTFDLPLLEAEFRRAGIEFKWAEAHVIDVFKLYSKLKPRNLTACVSDYATPEQVKAFLESPHDAMIDTRGTYHAFLGMLAKHADIPRTPKEIHDYVFGNDANMLCGGKLYFLNGEAVWNFGKHKGLKLKETPTNYLFWVSEKGSFSQDLVELCRNARKGIFPVPPDNASATAKAPPPAEDQPGAM